LWECRLTADKRNTSRAKAHVKMVKYSGRHFDSLPVVVLVGLSAAILNVICTKN